MGEHSLIRPSDNALTLRPDGLNRRDASELLTQDTVWFVPQDNGLEPTDFDAYLDYPAETAKDLAVRWYVKIERDPERAARLDQR